VHRRLLLALAGGVGSVELGIEDPMIVAFMTRLSNYVINDDTSFPFDHARVLDTTYFTWTGTPGDPLVCQVEGWYFLKGNFTTLGTGYGGADNTDWFAAISRNGLTLDDMVVAGRKRAGSGAGASADLFEISDDVYLEVGDEIFVLFQNTGASTLLVESNPSDGVPSGYLTDAGPGTLSPHLVIETRSGPAPV
jgi:hypothetical protein